MPDFGGAAAPRSLAIIGPPFSGKTVLTRQIAAAAKEAGRRVAHLTGRHAQDRLADTIAELANADADALVVIDDYHLLADPAADAVIQQLLAGDPAGPMLVLASRTGPGKRLAAARLRGAIVEIGAADLAFTRGEVAAFLGLSDGERKSDDFRQLMRSTDGWIAGICQVRDTLGRGADLATARRALSGATGLMREFIENEILANVAEPDRDLLRRLAPFRVVTLDLIESLTDDRPAARLAMLQQAGLIAQQSPDRPDRFAMNPLQSDYLEAELKDLAPEIWRDLLMRAANGYLAHGRSLAAADCLLRAQDFEGASAILGEYADQAFASGGEIHEFFALCQRLPGEYAEQFDRTFWIARGAVLAGSFGYAARLIKELDSAPGENGAGSDRLEVIRVLVALGFGDFAEVIKRGWPFLEADRGPPLDRAMVALALAQASAATLDLGGYGQALDRARAVFARAPAHYFQAWVAILSTMRLSIQGRLIEASEELERALASLDLPVAIRRTCELVLASYKRNSGKYDEAQALVDRAFRSGARHGISETVLASLDVACKLKLRGSGIDAALHLLSEAESWVARGFGEYCQRLLKLLRLELLLCSHGVEHRQAIRWLWSEIDAWEGSSMPVSKALDERVRLLRARHAVLEGEHAQALNILQPIIAMAKSSGRLLVWGEASLLRAACLKLDGRNDTAFKALLSIVETLAPVGCHGVILDNQYLLRGLEEELRAYMASAGSVFDPVLKTVFAELTTAMKVDGEALFVDDERILDVTLTETELKILNFAAMGMRNAEIASRMTISLQTVKWHMHNTFSKMNVRNRTSAIRRAQELLLISR